MLEKRLEKLKETNYAAYVFLTEGESGLGKAVFFGERSEQMQEVDKGRLERLYKRRGKLERAWDSALEEINDTVQKLLAELPMQGFDKDGQRQIKFDVEISLKGNVFSHTLKYEVA